MYGKYSVKELCEIMQSSYDAGDTTFDEAKKRAVIKDYAVAETHNILVLTNQIDGPAVEPEDLQAKMLDEFEKLRAAKDL